MNAQTRKRMKSIEKLRLPELQARFAEIVGEPTRSPNRKFLLRRIEEALAVRANAEPIVEEALRPARRNTRAPEPAAQETPVTEAEATPSAPPKPRGRFASMTIEELQTKYLEIVGRSTGSDDRRYLVWKIREAEKGRITVGPRMTRAPDGEPLDVKILPLRLEAAVADKMDEAWRAKGIKNRMEFFRGAIGHYLAHLGARDAAALFASPGPTGA
jgi:hypothetical protein